MTHPGTIFFVFVLNGFGYEGMLRACISFIQEKSNADGTSLQRHLALLM